MDDQTALILALQLVALCCIAVALLLYLLCRLRGRYEHRGDDGGAGAGKAVLVTCCDTAVGLQCALHLADMGCRVFAGLRDGDNSLSARLLRARAKERETEYGADGGCGALVLLPLDVSREDSLHEAVDLVRRSLPAGEDGLWAVVNTAGLCSRGRLEQQDSSQWDALFKHNVVGTLRCARTFLPLLRNTKGRLITLGASLEASGQSATGLVAYTAARYAVEGASAALRHEMGQHGVSVISLHPERVSADRLFGAPRPSGRESSADHTVVDVHLPGSNLDYDPAVLPSHSMRVLSEALFSKTPKTTYELIPRATFSCLNCCTVEKNQKHVIFRSNSVFT